MRSSPPSVVVEGIPLCAACLDAKMVSAEVFAVFPPGRVVARRLAYAASYFVVGSVLGVALGFAVADRYAGDARLGGILGGVGGFILAEIVFFLRGFSRLHHLGHAVWKKQIFLGTRGARIAVRRGEVAAVATERLSFVPPRTFVRVDRRDGTSLWLSWIEKPTFGENREQTDALATRVRALAEPNGGSAG